MKMKRSSSVSLKVIAISLCLSMMSTTAYAVYGFGNTDDTSTTLTATDSTTTAPPTTTSDPNSVIDTSQNDTNATQERMMAEAAEAKKKFEEQQAVINQEKSVKEEQLSSLQDQLADLKEEQKALTAKLSNVTGKKNEQIAIKESLKADLDNIYNQISVLNQKISLLGESITEKEKSVSSKKKEIDNSILQVRDRILESYKSGYSNPLSVVLGADSYYDSLVRIRVIKQISQHDEDIIIDLKEQRSTLEDEQKKLEQQKIQLQSDQQDYKANLSQLDNKIKQADEEIENISQNEKEYLASIEESKQKAKDMEADIANTYAAIKKLMSSSATSQYTGGLMGWPLPNYSTISSGYGWRFSGKDFHTGVDITGSGCMGAPIVAATQGKVIKTNYAYVPGRGYGIYVILDHGGGISTLYGHMSAIAVSEGQTVKRGQAIGSVGSTGWSTGAHLHFEVRKDGNYIDPMPYLKG